MTADEFFEFIQRPENRDRSFELERGEVVEMTKPRKYHGFVCGNICAILWIFAGRRRKGYACTNDTGVVAERDPDTVRGPDILFYEDVATPEQIDVKYGDTSARLSIEVLSPNDTHGTIMRRVCERQDSGIPLVWVVDRQAENVTVHRPDSAYVVEAHEELTGDDVLPDFRCQVAELFRMPGTTDSADQNDKGE